jgi:hypothetical protein
VCMYVYMYEGMYMYVLNQRYHRLDSDSDSDSDSESDSESDLATFYPRRSHRHSAEKFVFGTSAALPWVWHRSRCNGTGCVAKINIPC